jgi:hypothetical protein
VARGEPLPADSCRRKADRDRHPAIEFGGVATSPAGISSHLWKSYAGIAAVTELLQLSDPEAVSANSWLG